MNTLRIAIAAVLGLVAVTACQSAGQADQPRRPSAGTTSSSAAPSTTASGAVKQADAEALEIDFFDSAAFDADLSSAMRGKNAAIKVLVLLPFSLNEIPGRMEQWLSRVKKSGGSVKAQAIPDPDMVATRGLVGALIDVVVAVFDYFKKEALFGPADSYDAKLHYRGKDGMVEWVTFTLRAETG